MTVVVSLTQMLAEQADGATEVAVAGSTVGEALADLTRRHPGLAALV
ncbi:MAG: MoaD/ThiS family protein, partial [Gammaproteobacteria bacterium]|nr:MoaD/ThiS family protein [Gammaproteobacteria bacterium]